MSLIYGTHAPQIRDHLLLFLCALAAFLYQLTEELTFEIFYLLRRTPEIFRRILIHLSSSGTTPTPTTSSS